MRAVARGGKRDPRWFISVSSTRTSPDTASGSARRLTCGRSSSSCRARSWPRIVPWGGPAAGPERVRRQLYLRRDGSRPASGEVV